MAKNGIQTMVPGLRAGTYIFERNHHLLHADAWKNENAATGRHGSNLTISFLSLNRSSLSIRLLESIATHLPGFKGEVLVVDNCSDPEELQKIRRVADSLPMRCRILELKKNYGVGGARNKATACVNTEWIMNLDNDIYFIANPLDSIQRCITTLGCHFLSLPLLNPDRETIFAHGGHLYVTHDADGLFMGAGSASIGQPKPAPESVGLLCTFLFGGSCVVNVKTFGSLGGYDDNMFIGFEDLDFSVRLFQAGFKVGSIDDFALVHDHPKPASEADIDYEKQRFARRILQESAEHMQRKHSFQIWSQAVDSWLQIKSRELGLADVATQNIPEQTPPRSHGSKQINNESSQVRAKKPGVALIIDTDNWAFGNISRQIVTHCSDRFDFKIIPMDIIDNIDQVFLMSKGCDILHFFWREHLTLIGSPYYQSYAEILTGSYQAFHDKFIGPKIISTSIYDHLLLDAAALASRAGLYRHTVKGYTVASRKLKDIYANLPGYPPPNAEISDGIDLSLFRPKNLQRFKNMGNRPLVLGWVGNSKWASELEDFKGLKTIILPAIQRLSNEGLSVRAHFADRQERFIPHKEMPDYYSQIDVLLCASKIEGTPNPVLEAMACGIPVISTNVGIVPEAFGVMQKRFILADRTPESLYSQIKLLLANTDMLPQLSAENLKNITKWDWTKKAPLFGSYFDSLLTRDLEHDNT
jgi:GT2 family glycosyltransferase/glycosyltransferase involved in cell wall biosynthesis